MRQAIDLNHKRPGAGMLMMCLGVACLCINDALAKTLASTYSPFQILFLRNLIALPFAILIAVRLGGPAALHSHRPIAHLLRGVLWLCAAFLFVTSLKYLGLAEATALVFVAPLFITAISALFLRDHVGWRRWLAVLVGFAGVLVAVRPGGAAFQPASLLALATALFYAFLMISARWVDRRESVWTLMLYLTGAGALLSSLIVPFVWVPVQLAHIGLFAAIALFGTAGMTLMTQAFRLAPAVVVAPLDYTALIWATFAGWLVWNELPDVLVFAGAAIIIASGVFTIWRENSAEA
jgi:drug/metabolite transporter (DMT)-like permease